MGFNSAFKGLKYSGRDIYKFVRNHAFETHRHTPAAV
jgi:hypothetical protein